MKNSQALSPEVQVMKAISQGAKVNLTPAGQKLLNQYGKAPVKGEKKAASING